MPWDRTAGTALHLPITPPPAKMDSRRRGDLMYWKGEGKRKRVKQSKLLMFESNCVYRYIFAYVLFFRDMYSSCFSSFRMHASFCRKPMQLTLLKSNPARTNHVWAFDDMTLHQESEPNTHVFLHQKCGIKAGGYGFNVRLRAMFSGDQGDCVLVSIVA